MSFDVVLAAKAAGGAGFWKDSVTSSGSLQGLLRKSWNVELLIRVLGIGRRLNLASRR